MKAIDRAALKLALALVRASERRRQIDSMLADPEREWVQTARFASYCCQTDSLRLRPWMWPPCWIRDIEAALDAPDDGNGIADAARLLQRMTELGISKFHPTPVEAIEQAEAETMPV